MTERPRHDTVRMPPAVPGAAGTVARALREQPPGLDEIKRARMERSLVQAWRTHAAARVPLARRRTPARALWAASIAASAVAGGLIGFALFGDAPQSAVPFASGRFELRMVFVLHDVEGYTFAEIAGMTGLGISSLHGRLMGARKRLDRMVAGGRDHA